MNEEQLIQGCKRGDRIAQKQLYDTFSPRMYPLCCRYVKNQDDAEDVLVTAFTKIFDRLKQYRGDGRFESWIKRIVINESLTFLRKKKQAGITMGLEEIPSDLVMTKPTDHLEQEDLLTIISQLPPGYRIVFNLYAIDGFSHKEIAEKMNISESTSKSQLSRARSYLQKLLAERDISQKNISHDIAS